MSSLFESAKELGILAYNKQKDGMPFGPVPYGLGWILLTSGRFGFYSWFGGMRPCNERADIMRMKISETAPSLEVGEEWHRRTWEVAAIPKKPKAFRFRRLAPTQVPTTRVQRDKAPTRTATSASSRSSR